MGIMGCGLTSQIEREANGDIDSFVDGAARKITVKSIYRYLIRRVIETFPVDGPPKRGRNPVTGFKRKRRAPTQAELDALARANTQRRLAAEARRMVRIEKAARAGIEGGEAELREGFSARPPAKASAD
jgi:hypothetical protein